MISSPAFKDAVERNGFTIVDGVITRRTVAHLISALDRVNGSASLRVRGGVFAVRNLLDVCPEVKELANSKAVRRLVEPILGAHCFPVRGILFDKVPDANWKVPWHQDLTIAVQERIDVEGFGPWSKKAGVLHVQPPAFVLESMLSVRLHLDECGEDNGALRVVPGSNHHRRIPEAKIAAHRQGLAEVVCAVGQGGAMLMRPLLLHASSPSLSPRHRRVIHLDFASADLPAGLRWFSETSPLNI
jgi:ectoine hydroxylase-related dioxygenase (phytanoyl-CoA dioxygenase family)